jgi:hypothetical protein
MPRSTRDNPSQLYLPPFKAEFSLEFAGFMKVRNYRRFSALNLQVSRKSGIIGGFQP